MLFFKTFFFGHQPSSLSLFTFSPPPADPYSIRNLTDSSLTQYELDRKFASAGLTVGDSVSPRGPGSLRRSTLT